MKKTLLDSNLDEWIAAALDGKLSGSEQSELDDYLAAHPEARQAYEESQVMNDLLEKILKKDEPDPGFEDRMVGRFRIKTKKEGRHFWKVLPDWLQGPKAVYLGAAAALVISFYLGEEKGNNTTLESDYIQTSQKGVVLSGRVDDSYVYDFRDGVADGSRVAGLPKQKSDQASDGSVDYGMPVNAGEVTGYFEGKDLRKEEAGKSNAGRGDFNLNAQKVALEKPLTDEYRPMPILMMGEDEVRMKSVSIGSTASPSAPAAPEPKPDQGATRSKLLSDLKLGDNKLQESAAKKQIPDDQSSGQIQRKLIRNADIGLEVKSYVAALRDLTQLAQEEKGFVATQSDRTQANGHTAGQIVIKLPPERLDGFVLKLRELGTVQRQILKTDDVTKAYFDTEARLRNARKTEERLLELMAKKTDKVADLLQVEKEIGRVRESIEQMQGELKLWDSLASLATVTLDLVEQDMDQAAAYLLKERANLSLYSADVEKSYKEARDQAEKAEAQIVTAQVNRNDGGQMNATLSLLVSPDKSFALIEQLKGLGRVQSFDQNTERAAQDGRSGIAGTTRRDKVEIELSIVHDDASRKTVTLQVITPEVEKALDQCRQAAQAVSGEVLASTLQRNPNGHSQAVLTVRLPAKRVQETQAIFSGQGRVATLSVQRNDQTGVNVENEDSSPVILSLTLSDEEPAVQITRLEVQGEKVAAKVEDLKSRAKGLGIEIRSSSFSRSPDGVERANLVFRLPQKSYPALLEALQGSGKTLNLTLERRDRVDSADDESGNEPVEVAFSLKSPSPIVANENGFMGALRHTLSQSFTQLFRSVERIATGFAYLLPWLVAGGVGWLVWRRVKRKRG